MSDFPISNARSRVKPTMMAFGIAIVIVLFWTIGFAIQHRVTGDISSADLGVHMTRQLGIGLGASLGGALAVWLGLFFIFVRPVAPARGPIHLAVLAAVAVIIAAPVAALKVMGAAEAAESAALLEVKLVSEDRIEAQLMQVHNESQRILADGFMEPAALAQPGGIARARSKVEALRTLTTRSVADTEKLKEKARADIIAVPMSEGRRRSALKAFDRGYQQARADTQTDIDMAMSTLDEMDAQLDVLSRTPRAWRLEQGVLAFTRQRDLDDYNRHVLKAQDLARQIDQREQERANADADPFATR